jgi:benzoate 4-monooxygenase
MELALHRLVEIGKCSLEVLTNLFIVCCNQAETIINATFSIMGLLSSEVSFELIVVVFPILIIYWLLHPWFFSPLRSVPGPWYAVYTKWWLVYKTWRGVRAKTIHQLHLKYGRWVRVAPNEISTSDSKAITAIYGVNSEFTKTDFYTYQLRAIPELFTMSDRKAHAKRRRELAHLFSMSTITQYEDIIARNVLECMNLIATDGKAGKASNLYDWWHYLSMDITCELCVSSPFPRKVVLFLKMILLLLCQRRYKQTDIHSSDLDST